MALPPSLVGTTQEHIQGLIAARVQEGQHIEFKRDFPDTWPDATKKEFLADVTAFANAGGGDLLYGVDENDDAEASAVCPQAVDSVDVEVRRLLDLLLTQVEPRIPGVDVHAVSVTVEAQAGYVFVIRVPQSWAAPHRVKLGRDFFVREGRRKRPLDVPELRSHFLRTESQAQRLLDFRSDRLAKIISGQVPTRLKAGPRLVVHAIAADAALGLVEIDPVPYARGSSYLPVIGERSGLAAAYNFDGAFVAAPSNDGRSGSYTQLFRQGYFEAVWVVPPPYDGQGPTVLPSIAYESYTNEFLGRVRGELARNGLRVELVAFLSLLETDKLRFAASRDEYGSSSSHRRFDRQALILPDVLIPADVLPGRGMRRAYDLICQAAGLQGSANYGPDGEWKDSRQEPM